MKSHQLLKRLLTGAISLTLMTPLALSNYQTVNAARKWITITTNHDRLVFAKPGSNNYQYSNHNKGLRIINKGRYYYHHRLYYRVTVPAEHYKTAYILASQTSQPKLRSRVKLTRIHHRNFRSHQHIHRHNTLRRNRRTRRRSHQIHHSAANPNSAKMSSSQWYTTTGFSPIQNLNKFNHQIKAESLADIIQDRINNGNHNHSRHYVNNLRNNRVLNQLADLRAKQSALNFSHFEGHHDSIDYAYFKKDAKHLGLNANHFSWGENISRTNSTSDPSTIADQLNDGYMNKDAKSNWSHRDNILSHFWTHVGIGSYHNNQTNETYQTEIFTGK